MENRMCQHMKATTATPVTALRVQLSRTPPYYDVHTGFAIGRYPVLVNPLDRSG